MADNACARVRKGETKQGKNKENTINWPKIRGFFTISPRKNGKTLIFSAEKAARATLSVTDTDNRTMEKMMTGTNGSRNVYVTLGASNHSDTERHPDDLYCTHPDAVHELMRLERFSGRVWEPCDGLGHISDALASYGLDVRRSDLHTRGRDIERVDFLAQTESFDGDIITNPPYSCATAMVRKAIDTVTAGHKVAMWLRILYLESMERKALFTQHPPRRVWVSSRRIPCGKDGHFGASAQGYAWYVWEKGWRGVTALGWF